MGLHHTWVPSPFMGKRATTCLNRGRYVGPSRPILAPLVTTCLEKDFVGACRFLDLTRGTANETQFAVVFPYPNHREVPAEPSAATKRPERHGICEIHQSRQAGQRNVPTSTRRASEAVPVAIRLRFGLVASAFGPVSVSNPRQPVFSLGVHGRLLAQCNGRV